MNVIAKLSVSSVESQIEVIRFFIDRTDDLKSDECKEQLQDFLYEKEKIPQFCNYHLIGPKYALGCLTGSFLYHYSDGENAALLNEHLIELLNYVKAFSPSSSGLLKMTTTAKLIGLLDKFGFPDHYYQPFGTPLLVYYVPFQRSDTNAIYFPYINSIACFKPKKDCLYPEYIFLHEMGHLFAYNLTKDPHSVPESFLEFNRRYHPSYKGELSEIFADLFSVAVMMDTPFAAKNPLLKKQSEKTQAIVKNYFNGLMDSINNPSEIKIS